MALGIPLGTIAVGAFERLCVWLNVKVGLKLQYAFADPLLGRSRNIKELLAHESMLDASDATKW